MTTVINMRNAPAGWRNSPDYVYIGRGSIFGNPFRIGHRCSHCGEMHMDGGSTLACYREHLHYGTTCPVSSGDFVKALNDARGKILVCFCKPKPCHGDEIIKWLEENPDEISL